MPEPVCFNPLWKILISGFFGSHGFARLQRLLNYELLGSCLVDYFIRLEKKNTSLVIRLFPLGGLLIAKSRSSPLISSLSDRPPLLYKVTAGARSALTMILTLSLRIEGVYVWALVEPIVSEGMLVLARLVGLGAAWDVDSVVETAETQFLTAKVWLSLVLSLSDQ
jgi:hypothetical protein